MTISATARSIAENYSIAENDPVTENDSVAKNYSVTEDDSIGDYDRVGNSYSVCVEVSTTHQNAVTLQLVMVNGSAIGERFTRIEQHACRSQYPVVTLT